MSHSILLTGGSGYLGGTLLARWKTADLPPYKKFFALVRNDDQASEVKKYGAIPVSIKDDGDIPSLVAENQISIVFFLINAFNAQQQKIWIRALAEVQKHSGLQTHFISTTGAKMFSSHVGYPTDQPLSDTYPGLYEMQRTTQSPHKVMMEAKKGNCEVIDTATECGVRSYIFIPCIVYGEGEGFGNKISIQTVAIVKAALALRKVYRVDEGDPIWPACHVIDNALLYLQILRTILSGEEMGYNKSGYYLASSGSIVWSDLYSGIAKALEKRGLIDASTVQLADEATLAKMGNALGVDSSFVPVSLGGACTLTADNGSRIGWCPEFSANHLPEHAEEEVELILRCSKDLNTIID